MVSDQLHIEFAATELLRELFNCRDDWSWMSMVVQGAIGYHDWIIYYTLGGNNDGTCQIRISPPDAHRYMTIPVEERDFDLSDPQVIKKIEQFIDNWIKKHE